MFKHLSFLDSTFIAYAVSAAGICLASSGCAAAGLGREFPQVSEIDILPVEKPARALPEPAPAEDQALFPELKEGAVIAAGWGLNNTIPNDRRQSWRFEDESDWTADQARLIRASGEQLNEILPWTVEERSGDVDVIVRFDPSPVAPACLGGSGTCWFGNTGCLDRGEHLDTRWTCNRWLMSLSATNIQAWADRQVDPVAAFASGFPMVWQHEFGHSLGFAHESQGIMQALFKWTTLLGQSPENASFTACDIGRLDVYQRWVGDVESISSVVPPECSN
jgi:hypothetical protein